MNGLHLVNQSAKKIKNLECKSSTEFLSATSGFINLNLYIRNFKKTMLGFGDES